jgi:hypothetical protein
MKKLILVMLLVGGVAAAQGSGAASMPAPPPADPVPVPAPTRSPAELHQICANAMNADPAFAKSIVLTADKQIDEKTIKAHDDAIKKIAQEDGHVIYAYGALWVITALLVAFMWMRQQKLKLEIAALRRDLTKAES